LEYPEYKAQGGPDRSTKVNKAIEILRIEQHKIYTEYEAKTYELHLARQFGKKSELALLRREESDLWIRLETAIKLTKMLEAEGVEA
jgi:hypothetical protein